MLWNSFFQFRELSHAYRILSNEDEREDYDSKYFGGIEEECDEYSDGNGYSDADEVSEGDEVAEVDEDSLDDAEHM